MIASSTYPLSNAYVWKTVSRFGLKDIIILWTRIGLIEMEINAWLVLLFVFVSRKFRRSIVFFLLIISTFLFNCLFLLCNCSWLYNSSSILMTSFLSNLQMMIYCFDQEQSYFWLLISFILIDYICLLTEKMIFLFNFFF